MTDKNNNNNNILAAQEALSFVTEVSSICLNQKKKLNQLYINPHNLMNIHNSNVFEFEKLFSSLMALKEKIYKNRKTKTF